MNRNKRKAAEMSNDLLFVLLLRGTLLTPLMARNALKSNVTWSSYPFLPPTGASGCLAELVGQHRWHEGNSLGLDARRLQDMSGYENTFALGAYPDQSQISRRHFRSHLGSIFNYEATVWSAGRNEGKKLAIVEETLADAISFIVASQERGQLENLSLAVRGRLAPLAKKGGLQITYCPQPEIVKLRRATASGLEETLSLVPIAEMGSLPKQQLLPGQMLIHYVPVRSRLRGKQMEWDIFPSTWEEGMKFRAGTLIFAGKHDGRDLGISCQVWNRVKESWT